MTLILLLAAAVRITNIDGPALWTDEGFTYYTFKTDLFDALVSDRHPPFYFYTLHAWVAAAGDSILAMRWWSFLPSMLTIAVAYQLGHELVRYRPEINGGVLGVPVLAALLMALADGENYLAQELRMYTWHVVFAAWSTLAFLRYIRIQDRRWAAWWVFANVLLIYTHYFGAFVLIAQGLYALLALRRQIRLGAVAALVASGVLFLPWFLAVTLRQFAEDEVCVNCMPVDFIDTVLDFRLKWFGEQWPLMLALFLLGFVVIVYAQDRVQVRLRPPVGLLALLIVVPLVITYPLGHEEMIFFAHRLTQITVPIVMLMALGLGNLRPGARTLVVVAIVLYGVTTTDWYRIKVPWHRMTDTIAQYAEAGELALAEVDFEESALLYYYDHNLPDGMQISTFPVWSDDDPFVYYENTLPALLAEQRERQGEDVATTWVVYFSPHNPVLRKLDAGGFTRTMTVTYDHIGSQIDVYRYDLLPEQFIGDFENGMTLVASEINPESLRIDLWWKASTPLDTNYVVTAFLLDENGRLAAQLDSQPFENQRPTTTWQPGEVVYDPHTLIPTDDGLLPGEYTVNVGIYIWTPEQLIDIPTVNGEDYITVGTLQIN